MWVGGGGIQSAFPTAPMPLQSSAPGSDSVLFAVFNEGPKYQHGEDSGFLYREL